MNTKNVILVMAITTVFLVAAIGSASADYACVSNDGSGDAYFCGGTVLKSCTLNGSMDCAGGAGLIVGGEDIIIDGNGYYISGSPWDAANGVYNLKHDNVTIRNLEVKNFYIGIRLKGRSSFPLDPVEENVIENCKVHDNGLAVDGAKSHGILCEPNVKNSTITRCDIYNNTGSFAVDPLCDSGGSGIRFYSGSHNNTVTCNKLHNNTLSGVFAKGGPHYLYVAYNDVYENGVYRGAAGSMCGGIRFECKNSDHETVEYNTITNNLGVGIYTRGGNNTFRHNTIMNNTNSSTKLDDVTEVATGIGIFSGNHAGVSTANNTIYNNTVCNNTYLDMWDWITEPTRRLSGDYNTGNKSRNYNDTSALGGQCCIYTCNDLESVYFDFDEDNHYSTEPEDCSCNNILNVGSCCNPGLFNGSDEAKASYEASCNCQWTVGDDPNDCNASIPGAGEATFEKDLLKGWNLASLPLTPSDKKVSSVLNSVDGKYDAVVRYNAATHQFVTLSGSDEMDNGVGYFIHMTENGTWSYQGSAYDSINVGLSQGLNCIGWTNTSANLPGALNSITGNYNYVARWNATSRSYEAYEPNAPPPFNDFTMVNRGEGYWIAAKGSCTLVYP